MGLLKMKIVCFVDVPLGFRSMFAGYSLDTTDSGPDSSQISQISKCCNLYKNERRPGRRHKGLRFKKIEDISKTVE